jgi:hypothetical protein
VRKNAFKKTLEKRLNDPVAADSQQTNNSSGPGKMLSARFFCLADPRKDKLMLLTFDSKQVGGLQTIKLSIIVRLLQCGIFVIRSDIAVLS